MRKILAITILALVFIASAQADDFDDLINFLNEDTMDFKLSLGDIISDKPISNQPTTEPTDPTEPEVSIGDTTRSLNSLKQYVLSIYPGCIKRADRLFKTYATHVVMDMSACLLNGVISEYTNSLISVGTYRAKERQIKQLLQPYFDRSTR